MGLVGALLGAKKKARDAVKPFDHGALEAKRAAPVEPVDEPAAPVGKAPVGKAPVVATPPPVAAEPEPEPESALDRLKKAKKRIR